MPYHYKNDESTSSLGAAVVLYTCILRHIYTALLQLDDTHNRQFTGEGEVTYHCYQSMSNITGTPYVGGFL